MVRNARWRYANALELALLPLLWLSQCSESIRAVVAVVVVVVWDARAGCRASGDHALAAKRHDRVSPEAELSDEQVNRF